MKLFKKKLRLWPGVLLLCLALQVKVGSSEEIANTADLFPQQIVIELIPDTIESSQISSILPSLQDTSRESLIKNVDSFGPPLLVAIKHVSGGNKDEVFYAALRKAAENVKAQKADSVQDLKELQNRYRIFFTAKELSDLAEREQKASEHMRQLAAVLQEHSRTDFRTTFVREVFKGRGFFLKSKKRGLISSAPIVETSHKETLPASNSTEKPAQVNHSGAKRSLGLLDVIAVGMNAIIGAGIFLFAGKLALLLGPASILPFGLMGLLLLSVGLCFAEASTYFPRSGGPYLYAQESFGKNVGFGVGFMGLMAQMFGWAAVASGIASYLTYFSPVFGSALFVKSIAVGVITVMALLNYFGVKFGALANKIFITAKLVPLIIFSAVGAVILLVKNFAQMHPPSAYVPFAPHGWANFGTAVFITFFAFTGFETISVPAGEVKNPSKTIPKAVIGSLLGVLLLYVIIQVVAVGVYPALAASSKPLADAAFQILGPAGAVMMVLGAVFSTTGYNAGAALVTPRYLQALAQDQHLPSSLAKEHPRYGTPYLAVIATSLATIVFTLFFNFDKLVGFANLALAVQMLATCASIPFLRKKMIDTAPFGSYRLPLGRWAIPILGCAVIVAFVVHAGLNQVGLVLAILAGGFGLKFLSGLARKLTQR